MGWNSESMGGFSYEFPEGVTARASLEIADLFTFLVCKHKLTPTISRIKIDQAAFVWMKVDQTWIVQQAPDQGSLKVSMNKNWVYNIDIKNYMFLSDPIVN